MFTQATRHHSDPLAISVTGTVNEFIDFCARYNDDHVIFIGGFEVGNLSTEAQHDGKPAIRLALLDLNSRLVGRLVLLKQPDAIVEYLLEWEVYTDREPDAVALLHELEQFKAQPRTSSAVVDLAYGDDESLEDVIAQVSANYGVSVTVLRQSGAGGGWPEVRVSGFTDRVRIALREVWELDSDDIDAFIAER